MRFVIALVFWALALGEAQAQQFFIQPPSTLGMNLSGVTEEMPFLNIMKTAGGWYTETSSGVFTTQADETNLYTNYVDGNHYPTTLTGALMSGTFAQVSAYANIDTGMPSGTYVLLYTAAVSTNVNCATNTNCLAVGFGGSGLTCPSSGRCLVTVNGASKVQITIKKTAQALDPAGTGNYLNQIALVYSPDSTSSVVGVNETAFTNANCLTAMSTACMNPLWVSLMMPFKTFRMMDWGNTLANQNINWTDRSLPTWAFWNENTINSPLTTTGNPNGYPIEAMTAACNSVGADCWMNIPCMASQAYATSEAQLVSATLGSTLKVYPEYCNEIWNNGALSTTIQNFMIAGGVAAYPAGASCPSNQGGPLSTNFSNLFAYGILQQVLDINIFYSTLGSSRVHRVLAGQSSNTGRNTYILGWLAANCGGNGSLFSGTAATNADLLATAPYIGVTLQDPISWTADADGGETKFFTEQNSGGVLPGGLCMQTTCAGGLVTGNCGNGVGETCGGTTAYTVTTGQSLPSTPPNETCIGVKFNSTIGANATLAADGGTAFPLANSTGTALGSGAIASGADAMLCLTSQTSAGSVTAQWYENTGSNNGFGYVGTSGNGWIALAVDNWVANAATAASNGLGLVAYESGQQYVPGTNVPYQTLFYGAMRDSRMGASYTTYYTALRAHSSGVIDVFDNIGAFTQHGVWGNLEGITSTSSPRYTADKYFVN